MSILAVIVPEVHGILELVFLGLLLLLLVSVVVFAVYVAAQQFRNPGRPVRR
ncbi:MAG: hypothetical protein ACM3OO_02135 [Planctomycetaceae bacterium]